MTSAQTLTSYDTTTTGAEAASELLRPPAGEVIRIRPRRARNPFSVSSSQTGPYATLPPEEHFGLSWPILTERKFLFKLRPSIDEENAYGGGACYRPETMYELRVSVIDGVVAIFTWRDQETVHIWTVLGDLNEDVAKRIYEVEALLQENFKEDFDFYVTAGPVEQVREVLPFEAQLRFLTNI